MRFLYSIFHCKKGKKLNIKDLKEFTKKCQDFQYKVDHRLIKDIIIFIPFRLLTIIYIILTLKIILIILIIAFINE